MTTDDLPTLLSALSLNQTDESDAPAQLCHLQTLITHHLSSSKSRKQLSDNQTHEIIDTILTCMGTHLSHVAIQTACLAALSNLAYDAELNRDYMVGQGALTLTAETMRIHAKVENVQADACALLTNVCAANASSIRTKAGQELGIISLVVSAMQDHRGCGSVARYGCSALGALAVNDSANCATIGECGGLDVVVDVLGRYGGVGSGHGGEGTTIIDKALAALHNLTVAYKNNCERLARRHGSVATIVTALRGHEEDERITNHGLGLIRQLVEGYTICADGCARCGSAAVIVRAMESHSDQETIQTHGVALFRRLASTDPRRVELGLAGAVERTVRTMVAFESVREVQFQSAAALHNLSIDSEKNGDRVGAAGGIAALLKAIEKFEDDEKLVDVCCRTLHRLSYVGTNKMRIREEEPTNLLFNVSKRYPKTCGRTAKGVLKNV